MKSLIPVVMAGILGIYGMIVAVILSQRSKELIIQSRTPLPIPKEMAIPTWPQDWSADSAAL
jgi:hypothetical protein